MSAGQYEKLIGIFLDMLVMEEGFPGSTGAADHAGGLSFSQSPTGPQWRFTLPDLYDFCCQSNHELDELGYPGFRKLLYRNPTNQRISARGGQFVVVENKGHIDRNIYALIRTG